MENIDLILPEYLKKIGAPISKKYCQKLIVSHPEFPSLLSLSDVMERLGIPHQIASIDKEDLSLLEMPYLLHAQSNGGEMVPIHTPQDLITNKARIEQWSGIVLQAENSTPIIDTQHRKALFKEKFNHSASLILGLIGSILLIGPMLFHFAWLTSLLWLTAAAGTAIGYLLLSKDIGVTYKKVETFCNTGTQANCDKILTSAGAQIFGLVKLSDLVLAYFSTQLVAITLGAVATTMQREIILTLIGWGVLSVPIIFYSIYYQKLVAKAWCKLCLVIDAILLVQLIMYGAFYDATELAIGYVNLIVVVSLCLAFIAVLIMVVFVKQHFEEAITLRQDQEKASRIKHNPAILNQMFGKEKVDNRPFEKEVRIGKASAPIQIIMASNLFCNPCKEQHKAVSQLLAMYPDKVSVSFRFVLSGADVGRTPTSIQYIITYWLENIYGKPEESEKTEHMMHTWFSVMNLDKFMALMPIKTSHFDKESEIIGAAHYSWLNKVQVVMTPTFFINGYKMPKNYSIEDLKAMVPSLVDTMSHEHSIELNTAELVSIE